MKISFWSHYSQSHSTMISWGRRTSNRKPIGRDSPLTLSVWLSHPWARGTAVGRVGGLSFGGPGITGMCPPIGGLMPGAGPPGIIPGRGGPRRLGGGVIAPQEEEPRAESEVPLLPEMLRWFVSQARSLLSRPLLTVVSQALCVSYHCSVSVSRVGSRG